MNCSQARIMLAAYRELKNGEMETRALEEHLSSCADCKVQLTQEKLVGERIRALPEIKLPADAQTKLLKALATEHAHFIQHAPSSRQLPPIPVFLAPYLKEHGQEGMDNIAAFSTADTGPLPLIQLPYKRRNTRRSLRMNPIMVVGLAAAFLMTIMVGGLTSLVILANRGLPAVRPASVGQLSQLTETNYTTATNYTHIISAVGKRENIYYTAYGDNTTGWMLSVLDNQTKISTPLLSSASESPLIVLSSSNNWLIWLRFDLPKQVVSKSPHRHTVTMTTHTIRTWSLEATYLGTDPNSALTTTNPLLLQKDIFDAATAPDWVHTPIEGVWLNQNILLVTTLDKNGTSHLMRYDLDAEKSLNAVELANVNNGHILTSPTANGNGTSIYWSEEWMTTDMMLHSNIWTQKMTLTPLPLHGRWVHQTNTDTYKIPTTGTAFHPQVVNNTLFLLNVKNATVSSTTSQNPIASTVAGAVATSRTQATGLPARVDDTTFYTSLPDGTLQGTLQAYSALDDSAILAPSINEVVQMPQAGSRFILWQNGRGIGMYDAVAKEIVAVGPNPVPANSTLLAVNGDTTIWTINSTPTANGQNTTDTGNAITFGMFNWPNKLSTTP